MTAVKHLKEREAILIQFCYLLLFYAVFDERTFITLFKST